ncbi:nucleotidyl transferase AbiEii/AbiGii toxin family protein [Neorhizobium galegae]|uniref:Ync n=1 Tax=Neorhizobium galegae bv. orientalis str. HAMBI 540 TaxID=1028800 RepID=A0A068SY59_NEOGA|nr:nucleotidyl transferase AbiEii/AbiGii toxin family protein [Neorhizobium galegae]CDN51172.1 Hypothetical protein RG540_PA04940 [Neorhizobium galegae bv. orientalis str. HAMBI 540]
MNEAYRHQVRLLLDVLPLVAEEKVFALKGGTAINLFERDLPRLSVDIDLTYLPFDARDAALAAISEALQRIRARIEKTVAKTRVTLVVQPGGLEAKLHCQRGRVQIKIEVNPTLRGHLMPTRLMSCTARVQDEFEMFVEAPVVSHGEPFRGKICAATDRARRRSLSSGRRPPIPANTTSNSLRCGPAVRQPRAAHGPCHRSPRHHRSCGLGLLAFRPSRHLVRIWCQYRSNAPQ